MRRSIYKKIYYLTFDLDLEVKVKRNVAQYPLHHVTYAAIELEVARSNGSGGGDTFTRNMTDAQTHECTDGLTDGRRTTDRLWCEIYKRIFSKEKSRYKNTHKV